ncbi:DUF6876 family protein [Sinomicrobium sp. M5D2P9]
MNTLTHGNINKVIRKKIESFHSSGKLYFHPDLLFYYTDGIKTIMSLFREDHLFWDIAARARQLSGNHGFIRIRLYLTEGDEYWLEYNTKSGKTLEKTRIYTTLPIDKGISLCLYFIGRTLLLPTEY